MDIKTVTLTGAEQCVTGLDGQNTRIINKSDSAVYASLSPDIVPEADGVIEIAANSWDGLYNTNGTLYLLGTGKVELRGTDYAINFRQPSRSADSGGDTPKMPYMDGVVAYFTPKTFNAEEQKWYNAASNIDQGNMSIVSPVNGNSAYTDEDGSVVFPSQTYGVFAGSLFKTIYITFKTEYRNSNNNPPILVPETYTYNGVLAVLQTASNRKIFTYCRKTTGSGLATITSFDNFDVYNTLCLCSRQGGIQFAAGYSLSLLEGFYFDNMLKEFTGRYLVHRSCNINGLNNYNRTNIYSIAMCIAPHTDEQIQANLDWLKTKYNLTGGE